jgi:hypothetical protein
MLHISYFAVQQISQNLPGCITKVKESKIKGLKICNCPKLSNDIHYLEIALLYYRVFSIPSAPPICQLFLYVTMTTFMIASPNVK